MDIEGLNQAKDQFLQSKLLQENNVTFNTGVPSVENMEAFSKKMGDVISVEETKGLEKIENLTNQLKPGDVKAPGDEILMMLQKASSTHSNQVQSITNQMADLGNSKMIEMKDLVKLQTLSFEYQMITDLTSKGVNSFIQGTQTLFRNQ